MGKISFYLSFIVGPVLSYSKILMPKAFKYTKGRGKIFLSMIKLLFSKRIPVDGNVALRYPYSHQKNSYLGHVTRPPQ